MITYEKYASYRDSKKMKDSDVAKAAGIPQSTFSDWKKGKSKPKQEKMVKIAEALEMTYEEFVGPIGKFSAFRIPEELQETAQKLSQGIQTATEPLKEPIQKMQEAIDSQMPAIERLREQMAALSDIDWQLLKLYHNASEETQSNVMLILKNSQKEDSKSSKEA